MSGMVFFVLGVFVGITIGLLIFEHVATAKAVGPRKKKYRGPGLVGNWEPGKAPGINSCDGTGERA